jgi:hypothetical protein
MLAKEAAMSRETDPFKDMRWSEWKPETEPEAEPAPSVPRGHGYPRQHLPPKPGQFLNWSAAAQMLAAGQSVEQVACELGCKPQRIWRNLRRSRKFQARIQLAHDRLRMQASLRFRNLGEQAVRQLERGDKLDLRALTWLAERLGLGQAPSDINGVGDWYASMAQEDRLVRP